MSAVSAGQQRLQLVRWFPAAHWSNFSASSQRNRSERLHLVHEESRVCLCGRALKTLINIFKAIHAAAAAAAATPSVGRAAPLAGFHLKTQVNEKLRNTKKNEKKKYIFFLWGGGLLGRSKFPL